MSKRIILRLGLPLAVLAVGLGVSFWLNSISRSVLDGPVLTTPLVPNRLVESESVILALTPQLKEKLATSVLNLRLPDTLGQKLFAQHVAASDLNSADPRLVHTFPTWNAHKFNWPVQSSTSSHSAELLDLWRPLFEKVHYFERAGFKIIRAEFESAESNRLHAETGFEGVARSKENQLLLVKGHQHLVWELADNETSLPLSEREWHIVEWRQDDFQTLQTDQTGFAESLDAVVLDAELLSELRRSRHEEYILDKYDALTQKQDWAGPTPHFSAASQDRHPSVSVVDIDRDGLDDLYVMPQWGRNKLLRNTGSGFVDIAAEAGLNIDSHCTSAIFADFDNDGDSDLLLGRTLVPSVYLVNDNGQFTDRTRELVAAGLPSLVTSVSAADFNGDGLLDVYLSTYAADLMHSEREANIGQHGVDSLLSEFLSQDQARKLFDSTGTDEFNRFLNYSGPPNLLLRNSGNGRFEPADHSDQVAAWRHTYQASWSDYDSDGDPDLYLANDFAVNSLYRNDGVEGFTEVAESTGTTDIGFGMGASFGDFDNDQRLDLYVSNMFSKAGRRITSQLDGVDPLFALMARGNSLFRNVTNDRFEKVSGLETSKLQVEAAGWSWSGQFQDVDNDGWLDAHALSGYYSAPQEVAVQTDL